MAMDYDEWEARMPDDEMISAQVLLRSASGMPIDGRTAITVETIKQFAPSPEVIDRTTRAFASCGFDVGPVVGNSFSITAPAGTFEKMFDVPLHRQPNGAIEFKNDD